MIRSSFNVTAAGEKIPGNFKLFRGKGGKFRSRLKVSNVQIILASQGYKTKVSAKNGSASVKRNSAEDARFEHKNSKGKFMFNLKATNGQGVGTSERYETVAGLRERYQVSGEECSLGEDRRPRDLASDYPHSLHRVQLSESTVDSDTFLLNNIWL